MNKITIINAYGSRNIGDAAILNSALDIINNAGKGKCAITILCEDVSSLNTFVNTGKNTAAVQLPYGYAIRGNRKVRDSVKSYRFVKILAKSLFHIYANKLLKKPLPRAGFYSYILRRSEADTIFGRGGGYFTSSHKFKDYFGLLLSIFPVHVAKLYNKPILFLPITIGPFASSNHEKLVYKILRGTTVMVREEITLKRMTEMDQGHHINKLTAPDLALLASSKGSLGSSIDGKYIVLTAREWFQKKDKQLTYERELVEFVDAVWNKYQLKTILIPMARNQLEDDDRRVAVRMRAKVKSQMSFKMIDPSSMKELQKILNNARLCVCTRMHSAILSTNVETPFIVIGYGHKALGFVQSYGIEKWYLDIGEVTCEKLLNKFQSLLKLENTRHFHRLMAKNRKQFEKDKLYLTEKIINFAF